MSEEIKNNEENKGVVISKTYSRKVNLSAISSQYDNITLTTFVNKSIKDCSDDELKSELRNLQKLVFEETERDFKEVFVKLFEMSDDERNLALLGTGTSLEGLSSIEKISSKKKKIKDTKDKGAKDKEDGLDDWLEGESEDIPDQEDSKNISDQEEDGFEPEDVDLDDFEGGLLDG
jgi:hypothetical protein